MIYGIKIKKNAYLYFITKLILLVMIVFVLDFSIGHVLRYYFYKQECGRQYRAIFAIDKTTADVLVLGSSTAYHHYNPEIINQRLHQTCYNTGAPGQGILFDYAVLKAVLKRYSPKLIILDINLREFKAGKDYYDRLSFLLPFYQDHEEIRPIVDLKSPVEKFKLLSSIYAYNSSFLIIAGGNSEYFKKRSGDVNGYKPLNGVWTRPIAHYNLDQYPIDSIKINVFKSLVEDCRKAGTKLVIVCSPSFRKFDHKEYSISIAEQIAKERSIMFLDFASDTSFTNHQDYFEDDAHLNSKGSEVFTNIVIDRIAGSKRY